MTIEEVRANIEQSTGVPASLLTGCETAEEAIAQAKALLAYKQAGADPAPKSTREQFADWVQEKLGVAQPEQPADVTAAALADLETKTQNYPTAKDGGEIVSEFTREQKTTRDKFADWFSTRVGY